MGLNEHKNINFNFIYDEDEASIILNSDKKTLAELASHKKLPNVIKAKRYYGKYIYMMSRATYVLVQGLRKKGVTRILDLLRDASSNRFSSELQRDFNSFDLSSYMD